MLPIEVQYNRSEYKKDTKYIAGYLLKTSQKCGYRRRAVTENIKGYDIHENEFEPMAQAIADNASTVTLPVYLRIIFARAIRFRREVTAWYRIQSKHTREDAQHDAFANRLEATLNILRPYMPKTKRTKDDAKTSTASSLDNQFSKLQLQQPIDEDQEVITSKFELANLPSVPTLRIGADESQIEENFFIEIQSFLKELHAVRYHVGELWRLKETDLITKAVVTNTAIDLLRRKEYEFEQSLVRPIRFPVARFPIWSLPALLFYMDADLEPQLKGITIEEFALPSALILNSNALSGEGQKHAALCCYPVYNALKWFLGAVDLGREKSGFRPAILAINPGDLRGEAIHSDLFRAVEWAQCLLITNGLFENMLPEDEATRGIRHMCVAREVPLWTTFGIQILVDLKNILGDSVGDAFREVQRNLVETSVRIERLRGQENPLAAIDKGIILTDTLEHIQLLKSFLLEDRLVTEVRREAAKIRPLTVIDKHIGPLVKEKHYFWRNNPLRCGMIKYHLNLMTRHRSFEVERSRCQILSVAHLYNICRTSFPNAPHWPDMEFCIDRQDPNYLFHGRVPRNFGEAAQELTLAFSGSGLATAARGPSRLSPNVRLYRKRRIFQNPCFIDELWLDRIAPNHKACTTKEADESVRLLLNAITDRKEANKQLRLMNLPVETIRTNKEEPDGFLTHLLQPKSPLDLLSTLGRLQIWMELEQLDIHFDILYLLELCNKILAEIYEELREDSKFFDVFKSMDGRGRVDALSASLTLVALAAQEERICTQRPNIRRVRLAQMRKVHEIMQKHFLRVVKDKPGERTWVGDTCISNLVTTEKEKMTGTFTSPIDFFDGRENGRADGVTDVQVEGISEGPASASKLYTNWDFGSSREESKMFNALSRFRGGLEKRRWEITVEKELEELKQEQKEKEQKDKEQEG